MARIPEPRESGFTTRTNVPLYWVRYGPADLQPLLLLHGGPGADHRYLLPQMLRLEDSGVGHQLVLYDQRGGGRSRSDDREPITWQTQVGDVAAVVAELNVAPLTLVGYSWGGLLALLYALEAAAGRRSPLPDRLILIDPAPATRQYRSEFEAEFARRQAGAQVARMREELASSGLRLHDPEAYRQRAFELSVAGYFADPRAAHHLTPFRVTGRVQQSVWDSLGDFDLLRPGLLDSIHCPSVVIHGRQDPIPLASSEGIARALDAELFVLDQCGHVPYVEQPEELFSRIDEFLAGTGG